MKKLVLIATLTALAGCNTYITQEERLQIRADMARLQADQLYREQMKHYRDKRND